jgi:hypothetical protein
MRVFRNEKTAQESKAKKQPLFLNSDCPFENGPVYRLCGNWCALFHASKEGELSDKVKFVILGCKGTDKHLYVEDIEYAK